MKMFVLPMTGLALIAIAPAAAAQDTAPADETLPTITAEDIRTYASVSAKLNDIQGDVTLTEAERSAQMAAAVDGSGMDLDKFRAITSASRANPAVRRQIQQAMGQ
jgi:hypothetical protein